MDTLWDGGNFIGILHFFVGGWGAFLEGREKIPKLIFGLITMWNHFSFHDLGHFGCFGAFLTVLSLRLFVKFE